MRRCRQIRLIKGASEVGKSSAMPACGVVLKEIQIKAVIVSVRLRTHRSAPIDDSLEIKQEPIKVNEAQYHACTFLLQRFTAEQPWVAHPSPCGTLIRKQPAGLSGTQGEILCEALLSVSLFVS
jgi:hypothetical protein